MMTGQHFDSGGLSLLGLVDGYAKALVNHGAAALSNLLVPEWTSGDERSHDWETGDIVGSRSRYESHCPEAGGLGVRFGR